MLHTQLSEIWDMTLDQIVRYTKVLPTVAGLLNPFAAGGDEKPKTITDPAAIRAWAKASGIK